MTSLPSNAEFSMEVSKQNAIGHWYKDGREIFNSKKYDIKVEGGRHSLLIKDAGNEDVGEYTCQVKHVRANAQLDAQGWCCLLIFSFFKS